MYSTRGVVYLAAVSQQSPSVRTPAQYLLFEFFNSQLAASMLASIPRHGPPTKRAHHRAPTRRFRAPEDRSSPRRVMQCGAVFKSRDHGAPRRLIAKCAMYMRQISLLILLTFWLQVLTSTKKHHVLLGRRHPPCRHRRRTLRAGRRRGNESRESQSPSNGSGVCEGAGGSWGV